MASESATSNVILTGQSGYMKKEGSMTNLGTIHITDCNTSQVYNTGFIDENSKIDAFEFENTNDYKNAEVLMKECLGQNWLNELNENDESQSVLEKNAKLLSSMIQQDINKISVLMEV